MSGQKKTLYSQYYTSCEFDYTSKGLLSENITYISGRVVNKQGGLNRYEVKK